MKPPIRPPPKILLIHDDAESVASHAQYLIAAGLEVALTRSEDAVAVALHVQPDIIVLDFGCNGETMARLKGEETTAGIPVIALAALAAGASSHDLTVRIKEE